MYIVSENEYQIMTLNIFKSKAWREKNIQYVISLQQVTVGLSVKTVCDMVAFQTLQSNVATIVFVHNPKAPHKKGANCPQTLTLS